MKVETMSMITRNMNSWIRDKRFSAQVQLDKDKGDFGPWGYKGGRMKILAKARQRTGLVP